MSISLDCFLGMTRFKSSSTLKGDSYLRPARIFDSTGGPVPAKNIEIIFPYQNTCITHYKLNIDWASKAQRKYKLYRVSQKKSSSSRWANFSKRNIFSETPCSFLFKILRIFIDSVAVTTGPRIVFCKLQQLNLNEKFKDFRKTIRWNYYLNVTEILCLLTLSLVPSSEIFLIHACICNMDA